MRIRRVKCEKLPRIMYWNYTFNYNGFVIPMVGIVINKKLKYHYKHDSLIRHEFIHRKQYKALTTIPFILMYIFDIIINGYDGSLFEIDAREEENDLGKYYYTYAVRNNIAKTPGNINFRKGKKYLNPNKLLGKNKQ